MRPATAAPAGPSHTPVIVLGLLAGIALVGLILLAALGQLDDGTRTALVSVTTAGVAGAAGLAMPRQSAE